MDIAFIDLAAQQARIKEKLDARIQSVLAAGNYIMGPEVAEFEQKLAAYREVCDQLLMRIRRRFAKTGAASG